jgi:SAM-dependent methyltransferase
LIEDNPVPSHEAIDLTPRVHDQCVFETQMASRLKSARREERACLYSHVYGEYAAQFPEGLPQQGSEAERVTRYETAFLRRFLTPSTVMVEIGPGRCHLAFAVAPMVQTIYGVDVSALGSNAAGEPPNFEFRLTDGIHMPFDSDSVDLVISNQLMEHLHPEDANDQLQDIFRVLRPGGSYICVTPSRVNGPHDCSGYFDYLPCPVTGGHYAAT